MKKLDNKGITLIELIIAMTIMSTVVLIGYKIINGINENTISQAVTNNGQLSTNIVNRYLTKDIEKITEKPEIISKRLSDNSYEYIYMIKNNIYEQNGNKINCIEYKVSLEGELKNSNFKGKYDLTRTSKKIEAGNVETIVDSIDIVNGLPVEYENIASIEDVKPFNIEEESNLYTISLGYLDNKIKQYKFSVSPRIITVQGEQVEVSDSNNEANSEEFPKPSIPPKDDIPADSDRKINVEGSVGFWAADSRITKNNNLFAWTSDRKSENGYASDFEQHNCNEIKAHNISAKINGNAGNDDNVFISGIQILNGIKSQNIKKCDKVIVYVSKGTKVDGLKLNNSGPYNIDATDSDNDYVKIELDISLKWGLEIQGDMKISGNDGHVVIVYGTK